MKTETTSRIRIWSGNYFKDYYVKKDSREAEDYAENTLMEKWESENPGCVADRYEILGDDRL